MRGEAEEEGAEAESPPPMPAFGYASQHPSDLSPSHSRSYQELRPAHGAPLARDMQTYEHLEQSLFKPECSTDGAYLRGRSPGAPPSPEPERRERDDYPLHYQYTPAPPPPPYSHDHHHHQDS